MASSTSPKGGGTPGSAMRERSKKYSQTLRKESARKRKQVLRERAAKGQGAGGFSLGTTTLPKINLSGSQAKRDLDAPPGGHGPVGLTAEALASLEDTFSSSVGLGMALESLAEGEAAGKGAEPKKPTTAEADKLSSVSSPQQLSRRSSFNSSVTKAHLRANNRLIPNAMPMQGVLQTQDSGVWSSTTSERGSPDITMKLKTATPPASSLDPWLENEAKRENEQLIAEFEDELRYKIRQLAVEYDRLQFRALECEEVISTQEATVKLKTKMHKKDLVQRDKLLKREATIKEMIRRQEEQRLVVLCERMVYKHILQRVAKHHVETYKKVQFKQKLVEEEAVACKAAKKEQVKGKTEVNAAKIQKFKWLARQEEERKRKNKMIAFRRGELAKLKNQSKKLGLVTESQIINSNFLGLINTVQNAGIDDSANSSEVDKTTNTMMQLHKLYKVTDTANADEVISVWNRSVEGLANLRSDRDAKEKLLESLEADKLALQEDLELLHLTGKGIFMEKTQEVKSISLQSQLDSDLKELETKSKALYKSKLELRVIYQGVLNMLKKMKGYASDQLNVLNENVLGALKHQINIELAGSMPDDLDPSDVSLLFKHFEEAILALNKLNLAKEKGNLAKENQS